MQVTKLDEVMSYYHGLTKGGDCVVQRTFYVKHGQGYLINGYQKLLLREMGWAHRAFTVTGGWVCGVAHSNFEIR